MRKLIYKYLLPRFYHVMFGINTIMNEMDLSNKKCLCIAPHPDDESIGMGGTIAKFHNNFDVVCMTDGARASSPHSKEELIKIREQEFIKAMEIAKVNEYKLLGLPDKALIVNSYEKQLDIENYDYIFIPNLLDQHRDHKSVAPYVSILLKNKKHKKELKIAFYEVWSALALPNGYVDIREYKDTKKEMINSHKSQIEDYDYTNKALALNFYRGLASKKEYVESFMVCDINLFKRIEKACAVV